MLEILLDLFAFLPCILISSLLSFFGFKSYEVSDNKNNDKYDIVNDYYKYLDLGFCWLV